MNKERLTPIALVGACSMVMASVALAISWRAPLPAEALSAGQPTPAPTPAIVLSGAAFSSPQTDALIAALQGPDLILLSTDFDRNGYRVGDPWFASTVVVNSGNEPSPATDLIGYMCLQDDGALSFFSCAPTYPSFLELGSVPALAPGASAPIESPVYDFASLPAGPGGGTLVPGLPDNGLVYLSVHIDTPIGANATSVEVSVDNNGGFASAVYPTGPADPSYDPALDADQDGWEASGGGLGEDCNDGNPLVHPTAPEIPGNGIDEDCSGGDAAPLASSGEEVPGWDLQPGYEDDDGDGYPANTNYYGTPIPNDCNDGSPTTHPGAEEIEDGFDNDCDGVVDEGFTSFDWETADVDYDGYSVQDGDCNDFAGGINPNAAETDDGLDNNCNGLVDETFATPDWILTELVLNRSEVGSPTLAVVPGVFYQVTVGKSVV